MDIKSTRLTSLMLSVQDVREHGQSQDEERNCRTKGRAEYQVRAEKLENGMLSAQAKYKLTI